MNADFLVTLAQFSLKLTLVLTAAWCGHAALARRNPRWRVWLWRVAGMGGAVLLGCAALPPLYGIPLLTRDAPQASASTVDAIAESASGNDARPGRSAVLTSVAGEIPGSAALQRQADAPPNESLAGSARSSSARATPGDAAAGSTPESPETASQKTVPSTAAASPQPVAQPRVPIRWFDRDWLGVALVALYGAIVAALLVRLVAAGLLARRLVCAATAAPDWVQAMADEMARQWRSPGVTVRMTDRGQSPLLIGMWRPTILLPVSLLESAVAERDLRGAIAHEAAHAVGGDLGWDVWLAVVSAFLWPHPLAWRMRAAHRGACERVSDRLAADELGDVGEYQSLLARIALRVSDGVPSPGLAMARRALVRDRLAALVSCPVAPRLGRRGLAAALGAIGLVTALGTGSLVTRPSAASAAQEPADDSGQSSKPPTVKSAVARSRPEQLEFTVVRSDTGAPVADAKIGIRLYGEQLNVRRDLTTGADGRAIFEYPDGDQPVSFWSIVKHPGLVPYYVNFGRSLKGPLLPTRKTISMAPGQLVGGTIVDPAGQPVAGAQVSITVPAVDTPSEIHYTLFEETTGADGQWRLYGAPLDLAGISLRIEHPRFVTSGQPVQTGTVARYALDPGLTLSGRVVDEAGQPVPDAHITVGRDRFGTLDKPVAVEKDGTYTVYALRKQSTWVTAEAAGFAPVVKAVELDSETPPVDFELKRGATTRFRVVDRAGEPVGGVRIVADTWGGFRSLWWEATTDDEGNATWTGAPADAVEFHVLKRGYAALRDVLVGPQEEPHVLTLRPPLRVTGLVTDSAKQKVGEFRVRIGRKFPGRDEIHWLSYHDSAHKNGSFEVSYDEQCDAIFIQVEAAGSRPWVSEALSFEKGTHRLFVRLEKGSGPAGIVTTPDGEPAPDAQVTLLTEREGMQFTGGYRPHGGKQTVAADQDGRFEFLPVEGASLIVAVHESGYAELSGDEVLKSGGIRLLPWARVEVTARRGAVPLAGATVDVQPEWQRDQVVRVFSYGITGTTDKAGQVVLNRVVPRKGMVSQTLIQPIGSGSTHYPERSASITPAPGETVTIEFGGTGSIVTGRFAVSGKPPANHQWSLNEAVSIASVTDREAGRLVDPGDLKEYRFLIGKDGSFRADDIPPGRYDLSVNLTAAPDPGFCGHGETIGRITRKLEVPADGSPVDLGEIAGTWFQRLGAGESAPLFVAAGIGTDDVRLGALRGRLVLIDFWATWCAPCLAEMPAIARLHEEFASDRRFELLGLSLDNSVDAARMMIDRQGWSWRFAYAGPGTYATIPTRFEVKSIPEKFLIDVDGTILYRGRDLEEIARLVRKRLDELPAGVPEPTVAAGIEPVAVADDFPAGPPVALALAPQNIDFRGEDGPALTGPGLHLWAESGQAIRSVEGVGTHGWVSGPQRLAIDPQRDRLYFCDTRNRRLMGFDRHGRQLFTSDVPNCHAAAVDESTGDVWCLTLGNLNSGELLILDAAGREQTRYPVSAFGIAYSPVEDAFWIVGKTIAKVTREGKTLSSHQLPDGGYTFSEVAVDRERGGAWVIESDHPDRPHSRKQLWKVSPAGDASATWTFPRSTLPGSLVCVSGTPWLSAITDYSPASTDAVDSESLRREILRFELDGTPADSLAIPAHDLVVGLRSGVVWVQFPGKIVRLDRAGNVDLTIPLPEKTQSVRMAAF